MSDSTTLVNALRAVLPHASQDGTLPVLNGIHITPDGIAEATDRYTLAQARFDDGAGVVTEDLYIPGSVVKQILAAKSYARSIDGTKLVLGNGQAFALQKMSDVGDYPNLARLIPGDDAKPGEHSRLAFNVSYLGRFDSKHFPHRNMSDKRRHAMTFTFGAEETKPVLVTNGQFPWFTGLIMPVRVEAVA